MRRRLRSFSWADGSIIARATSARTWRDPLLARLKSAGVADDIFLRPLHEYIAPVRADVVRTFGEPLPKGLELESTANCLSSVAGLTS